MNHFAAEKCLIFFFLLLYWMKFTLVLDTIFLNQFSALQLLETSAWDDKRKLCMREMQFAKSFKIWFIWNIVCALWVKTPILKIHVRSSAYGLLFFKFSFLLKSIREARSGPKLNKKKYTPYQTTNNAYSKFEW